MTRIVDLFESLLCLVIIYGMCALVLNIEYVVYAVIAAIAVVPAVLLTKLLFYCR